MSLDRLREERLRLDRQELCRASFRSLRSPPSRLPSLMLAQRAQQPSTAKGSRPARQGLHRCETVRGAKRLCAGRPPFHLSLAGRSARGILARGAHCEGCVSGEEAGAKVEEPGAPRLHNRQGCRRERPGPQLAGGRCLQVQGE